LALGFKMERLEQILSELETLVKTQGL
jgi:hypothetical protein